MTAPRPVRFPMDPGLRNVTPWLVIYDGECVWPCGSEDLARSEAARCAEATAGNVDAVAVPLALALSAPELLAALRACAEVASGAVGWIPMGSPAYAAALNAAAAARAAIARAEGREP